MRAILTARMKLLNLNCQKAMNPNFMSFLKQTLNAGKHEILLLQEAPDDVISLAQQNAETHYNILRHRTPFGISSELCILHSSNTRLIDSSFAHIEDASGHYFGVLMGAFRSKTQNIVVANIHLPAYLQPLKRLGAIQKVKQTFDVFLKKHPYTKQVILAGDFNSILPWEHRRNKGVLSSILLPVQNRLGYTHRSHRLEPGDLSSRMVYWLGKIGISFRTTLDYVFASHVLVHNRRVRVRVLNKDVSDHLPMLIEIH